MKNKGVLIAICLLAGLAAGFGGGYYLRNYQLTRVRTAFGGGNGNFQRFTAGGLRAGSQNGGNGAFRGGAVQGTILSMDDKSFTVKLADGSSKIVFFAGNTTYSSTQSADKTDIKVGGEVAVFGTPNSDGSVTATNVQLNPMAFRPQGSPAP